MASATIPCTAPLNIVQNLQTNKICKLKCAYQFTYAPTSLRIFNAGSFIIMTTDEAATPPVNYNDINYNVQTTILVQPSLHKYNGQHADAELIITHSAFLFLKPSIYIIPLFFWYRHWFRCYRTNCNTLYNSHNHFPQKDHQN